MSKAIILFTVLWLLLSMPAPAQSQPTEPLGDVARQLRAQQEKEAKKPAKVFTNDNLPTSVHAPETTTAPASGEQPSKPADDTAKSAAPPSDQTGSKPPEPPDEKVKTRDYWQQKFSEARQNLAKAKERQQLAEDELNLLQIQQAREMDPTVKADLTNKVQTKQSEVDAAKEATDAAQKALDDLGTEFKESGAPDDWSVTA